MIQRIWSKWAKTKLLLRHSKLKEVVPETKLMNFDSLHKMLHTYPFVYIKPIAGTFGNGVMRVEKLRSGGYQYQSGLTVLTFRSYESLYASIMKHKKRPPYLVQRGIRLLQYHRRKFDIRVMVQKAPNGTWETTGFIGRVAHPHKIVTNYHSGGTPMPLATLLSSYMTSAQIGAFCEKLEDLGVQMAQCLQERYPHIKEIGADIAVDRSFTPWILEINTMPDIFIFKHLKDKAIVRKMYRYAVAYGRYRKTNRIKAGKKV